VGLSRIAHSDLVDCSARLRLVGQCHGLRRVPYARCVGSSVDEGDGLLNLETSGATQRAPRRRYLCLPRASWRIKAGTSAILMVAVLAGDDGVDWASVTRRRDYLAHRAVGARRRPFSVKLVAGESRATLAAYDCFRELNS
jgi:hypothetical protein